MRCRFLSCFFSFFGSELEEEAIPLTGDVEEKAELKVKVIETEFIDAQFTAAAIKGISERLTQIDSKNNEQDDMDKKLVQDINHLNEKLNELKRVFDDCKVETKDDLAQSVKNKLDEFVTNDRLNEMVDKKVKEIISTLQVSSKIVMQKT